MASARTRAWVLLSLAAGARGRSSASDGPPPGGRDYETAAERAAERARASLSSRVPPGRVQLAEGNLEPVLGAGRPLPQVPPMRPRMESISGDANTQLGIPELAARLKKLYKEKLLPLERMSLYSDFYGSYLTDSHFDSRPMVLLIGPYSVGKTSFIKYLLGRSFPGERIGPEPTTDRFIVVMAGSEDRVTPGNALAANSDTPFQPLSMFGTQFLNKLEASQLPAPILQRLTLVDTPGVLSGERQREMRGYDVYKVRTRALLAPLHMPCAVARSLWSMRHGALRLRARESCTHARAPRHTCTPDSPGRTRRQGGRADAIRVGTACAQAPACLHSNRRERIRAGQRAHFACGPSTAERRCRA